MSSSDDAALFDEYRRHAAPKESGVEENENHMIDFARELLDITEYRPMYSGNVEIVRTAGGLARKKDSNDRKFGDKALLLRRIIFEDPSKPQRLRLEIQSSYLQESFRKVAAGLSTVNLYSDPIIINEPYREIYWFRESFLREIDDAASEDAKNDLRLFIDFETRYMSTTLSDMKVANATSRISYQYLWALFPPGVHVVLQNTSASRSPVWWCVVLRKFEYVGDDRRSWKITFSYTGFDGYRFGEIEESHQFSSFTGHVDIELLPAYPLSFHTQGSGTAVKESLLQNGRLYQELCDDCQSLIDMPTGAQRGSGSHRTYSGPFWTPLEPHESRRGCSIYDSPSLQVDGRVMIDPLRFSEEYPLFRTSILSSDAGVSSSSSSFSSTYLSFRHQISSPERPTQVLAVDMTSSKTLQEGNLMTFPPFIPAYSFSAKRWGLILLQYVENIAWKPNSFESLQLDKALKATIRRLISGHSMKDKIESSKFDDFIPDKGRGLVFLLHGPPGSGKTMTAESVCESLESPLYSITGGELGTVVDQVESRMQIVFQRITRWKAVLLIDEADTFMAKRREDSIERNALISVLLRLLEYQSGIIFLTTNRMTDFDDAFYSRIHVTLAYRALTDAQRQGIWRDLAKKSGWVFEDDEIQKLGTLPIDGRNIKNVLRVASILVKDKAQPVVRFRDIQDVVPITIDTSKDLEVARLVKQFLEY